MGGPRQRAALFIGPKAYRDFVATENRILRWNKLLTTDQTSREAA